MSDPKDVICFQCSQKVGSPPQLNLTADGEVCRACRDRLLESVPPIFHVPFGEVAEARREEADVEAVVAPSEPASDNEPA